MTRFLVLIIFLLQNCICFYSKPTIEFDAIKNYSLNCLKIKTSDKSFYPCNMGGVSVIHKGIVYYPWSENIYFVKLGSNQIQNKYNSEWLMIKKGEFYYHYQMQYTLNPDNVVINAKDLGRLPSNDSLPQSYADVNSFYLDRCEGDIQPYIIGVPYLTTFSLLLAEKCFVSLYIDWNKTNCSELIPYNSIYSPTSVYYSQYALYNPSTNGRRNQLDETIILKVSESFDEVLPEISNPVSEYKLELSNRIIFDDWLPFNGSLDRIKSLKNAGIGNLWHFIHDWQKGGYDVALPDVFPANNRFGGNAELLKISEFNKENNFLFGLHENYIDIYKASTYYRPENLAINSNGSYKFNWHHPQTLDSSFLVKPSKVLDIAKNVSTSIHNAIGTTSVFHDVASSYDPSKFVDYDERVENSGKFSETYNFFKKIPQELRNIHKGPVSGEGLAHFLYVGYFDDICAQLHTAQSLPGSYYGQTEKLGGFYKPLLVNFDLIKLKEKASVHGMGYYERFFYKDYYWKYHGRSRDSALMYAATEIAFGHCAFFTTDSYNLLEQAKIEFEYVFPLQQRYSNAKIKRILYNDGRNLMTASDYIRKFPNTFHDFFHKDFMAQLFLEYDNGLIILVNRHPEKKWEIEFDKGEGYYNYHASKDNSEIALFQGISKGGKFILPSANGWLCFAKQ